MVSEGIDELGVLRVYTQPLEESETQADTVASEEAIVDDLVSAPGQQQHSPSIPPSQAPQQQDLKRRSEAIAEKQSRPSTPKLLQDLDLQHPKISNSPCRSLSHQARERRLMRIQGMWMP